MVLDGLSRINQKAINEKSKLKNDGVYTFRGVIYRVYNNKAVLYGYGGMITQQWGGFNVDVGSYSCKDDCRKKMKAVPERDL